MSLVNFAPEWSLVRTTWAAETPVLCMSTGIPRPLSSTRTLLSTRILSPGRLEATVSTAAPPPGDGQNALEHVTFGAARNAVVTVGGVAVSSGAPVALGGASTVTFVVQRAVLGEATTVPLTVRDRCGDWTTFVGGGPTGF